MAVKVSWEIAVYFAVADDGAAAFGGEDTPVRNVVVRAVSAAGHERPVGVQGAGQPRTVIVLPCWVMPKGSSGTVETIPWHSKERK